jgi:LacI family transcriptional regulator
MAAEAIRYRSVAIGFESVEMKQVTIKDIAQMAGVSVSTVSRALNDTGRIDQSTKDRIIELSDRLSYRPSAFARGLVLKRTKAILFLAPNIANVYFAEVTQSISSECRRRGYNLLLGDTNEDPNVAEEYLDVIRSGTVDGAIVALHPAEKNVPRFLDLANAGFPIVFTDPSMAVKNVDYVIVDNKTGAEKIIDYLVSKGHSRIGFIAHKTDDAGAMYERFQGYHSGHAQNGLKVNEAYIEMLAHPMEQDGIAATEKLLSLPERPTAIFAFNDMVAMGCMVAIRRKGLHVPEDVAVVGYDDIEIGSFLDVALTTVSLPKEEISCHAVKCVVDRIEQRREGKSGEPPHRVVLTPKLVIRESA